jgi:hypothetical protein
VCEVSHNRFFTWYQSLGSEVQWTDFDTWIAVSCRGFCLEERRERGSLSVGQG